MKKVTNQEFSGDTNHLITLFELMGCNLENVHIVDAD